MPRVGNYCYSTCEEEERKRRSSPPRRVHARRHHQQQQDARAVSGCQKLRKVVPAAMLETQGIHFVSPKFRLNTPKTPKSHDLNPEVS
ncbi:unnamed protein product [Arctogadus glacialis]